ncbi:WSC domain-containing protein [Coprinopsis sp. MPI-PUGE-AT-0042]|nr:WSC domain-containing protein [Coprinopsis sp. MPI-PUGE-AT-0042]
MVVAPVVLLGLAASVNAYWLMGVENFITTERVDPITSPARVASHVHSVLGGSNFRMSVNTASLRQSSCTSIPIPQDKSNYWFPHLYFQCMEQWQRYESRWRSCNCHVLTDRARRYYLFNDRPGTTTAFPDDNLTMGGRSGDMTLRTSHLFLCLDFSGVSTKHTGLPKKPCPSGIRAQINFPSCWDGKNVDSPDHKSHVAFPSGGPDSGTCNDARYPVTIPRIFLELYWGSNVFDSLRNQAKDSAQPFVFAQGDSTGYGYHADFVNGWEPGVLQKAVDQCTCSQYGDPACCAERGIFSLTRGKKCRLTKSIDETTTGTLPKLPGNNPVVGEGKPAPVLRDDVTPALISPVYVYTGDRPTATGTIVSGAPATNVMANAPIANPTQANQAQPSSSPAAASSASPPSSRPSRTPANPRSENESVEARSELSDTVELESSLEEVVQEDSEPFSAGVGASRLAKQRMHPNYAFLRRHETNF